MFFVNFVSIFLFLMICVYFDIKDRITPNKFLRIYLIITFILIVFEGFFYFAFFNSSLFFCRYFLLYSTFFFLNSFFYLKILKYLIPVLSPHIAKSTMDATITPIILDRYR